MGIYDELSKLEQPSPAPAVASKAYADKNTSTSKLTQKSTLQRDKARPPSRVSSRKPSRENPRALPTRDEIQEFSFRLRDELKVKVQAEVPHRWQKDLEAIARDLDVRKLELYRFILGEFLGKVKRKSAT